MADFVITGVPFTDAELAERPQGAGEIIGLPLSVGSTAIIVGESPTYGWATETLPCTPEEYEQGLCEWVAGPPLETVRIPSESLSALIAGKAPQRLWSDPGFAAALGTVDLKIQKAGGVHTFLNRTEAASQNKYLLEYAKTLGPAAWADTKARDPGFAWEPIGEVFSPRTPSKYGMDTQVGSMSLKTDPVSGGSPPEWTGNMGPVPTTLVAKITADFPVPDYRVAEIQNANGDWVLPTRETLDAALAAGTEPIVAVKQKVPGAYPLVFINNLYTVAGTLSPDEANSLAAFVRYVVTDGQQLVIDHGATDLPDDLRTIALAKADQIVAKNCTKDGYEVTTSAPSAFEPETPGVQAIGVMKHCTVKPPPPTTTTTTTTLAPTTTTTTVAPTTTVTTVPTVQSQSPAPRTTTASPTTTTPPPTTTPVTTTEVATTTTAAATTTTSEPEAASSGGSRPRGVALAQLPMVKPRTGAEEATRLGTLLLGAAIFLGGRRGLLARRSKVA